MYSGHAFGQVLHSFETFFKSISPGEKYCSTKRIFYKVDLFYLRTGVYKFQGGRAVIKSVGLEYQVVKRRREYHGCGKEYIMKKGKGEAYHLPYYVKAV